MAGALLTTEQVLLLENLMYLPGNKDIVPGGVMDMPSGTTIGEMLENVDFNKIDNNKDYSLFTNGKEWKEIISAIKSDETLMNMTIVTTHTDKAPGGGGGESAVFANPQTGEAVVAFKGTASYEWKDDFLGGATTDTADGVSTPQQENALEWYQSLDLEGYETVTVTGHSKGGNKAKYITVMDPSVDRCVSFDGQGFSDEFMETYSDEIALRQNKIENHNAEYDYVNLLLNDIGEKTYYKGYNIGEGGIAESHCPNTYLKSDNNGNCSMTVVNGQPEEMQQLDEFLNNYIRSMNADDKKEAMEFIGTFAEAIFNEADAQELLDIILDGDNIEQASYLLAYLIKYEQKNPEFADSIRSIMKKFGWEDVIEVIDAVDSIMGWKYFDEVVDALGYVGDHIPAWMLEKLIDYIYENTGIKLSIEDARKLLSIIGNVGEEMDNIKIRDNGKDIQIASLELITFSFKPQPVKEITEQLKNYTSRLEEYGTELKNISAGLSGSAGMNILRLRAGRAVKALEYEAVRMEKMKDGLESIRAAYVKHDDAVKDNACSM